MTLPMLGSAPVAYTPYIGDFATQMLMADTYARLAQSAGMLNVGVSVEQAKMLILRGFELGVPPLRALTEVYLAPNERGGLEFVEEAGIMRARIASSGVGVIEPLPEHCDEKRATVRAIRHDRFGRREALFTFSLDDATRDGLLLSSPKWQSGVNRPALLVARATTLAGRSWFEDVLGGRYTHEELGGGGPPSPDTAHTAHTSDTPAPAPAPHGAGQVPASPAEPVRHGENGAGAPDAGGSPPPPVAPPQGAAAAPKTPPSPPPPELPPNATKEEKLAHYARVSEGFNRPWTVNAGMSRDPAPVPIITHGATPAQLTHMLDYMIEARKGFTRAKEATELVVDHLGKLGIDTSMMPLPYYLFALSNDEAQIVCEGLDGFAEQTAGEPAQAEAQAPPNPLHEVQPGQAHSWQQANEKFEAVVGKLAGTATRGQLLGLLNDATGKTFYELSPDELWKNAADLEQLSVNPTIFAQALARMKMSRGG